METIQSPWLESARKSVTIFKFPRGRPFNGKAWRLTLKSVFLYADCTSFRQSLAHTKSGWIHDLIFP